MAWFPLVGAGIGLLLWGSASLTSMLFPAAVAGALVLVIWTASTGLLHLDGYSDCCDGLLASVEPRRRLEILHDSHVGAYAVVGVCLLLLLKWVLISTWLEQRGPFHLLVGFPLCGRWSMVLAANFFPYARREGMGGYFRQGLGWPQVLAATLTLIAVLALLDSPLHGLSLAVGALLSMGSVGWWASRRLGGGITGDVYGAINECVEIACLLIAVTWTTHSG